MRNLDSNGKPSLLPESERLEILGIHLPYRIALLKTLLIEFPLKRWPTVKHLRPELWRAVRLLSFLGIGYDRKARRIRKNRVYHKEQDKLTDEVKLTDLDGRFVEIDELTDDQKAVLSRFNFRWGHIFDI